jgi:hypothetical protein
VHKPRTDIVIIKQEEINEEAEEILSDLIFLHTK